jgi:hypothetical protein
LKKGERGDDGANSAPPPRGTEWTHVDSIVGIVDAENALSERLMRKIGARRAELVLGEAVDVPGMGGVGGRDCYVWVLERPVVKME